MSHQRSLNTSDVRFKPRTLSGRDIGIVQHCVAPGVFALRHRTPPGPAQWWGIFIGRFLEYAVRYDRDYALEYIEQKFSRGLNTVGKIDVEPLIAMKPRMEVAVAYEPKARIGYELENARDTDAEKQVTSRMDGLITHTRIPHVFDFKSGEREYDPATMTQMLTAGVTVATMVETLPEAVDLSIVNVISSGVLRWKTERIPSADLLKYGEKLRKVHLSVLLARTEYDEDGDEPLRVPGKHCHWCDLRTVCPEAEPAPVQPKKSRSKK